MMNTTFSKIRKALTTAVTGVAAAAALTAGGSAMAAWEPSKPVEFVVPAGTGGGADQMARLIQGIIVKHKLMKVRRRRRGRVSRREGGQERSPQDHHYVVKSLHNADGYGCALQLEGHDAGNHDGA